MHAPPPTSAPRLIRFPEVERITSLKRSAIYARIATGEFPAPRALSARCTVWLESEILDWIQNRPLSAAGTRSAAPRSPALASGAAR